MTTLMMHQNPCPVVKVKDDLFVHEQYHGPTRAFKDMALQPFGSILSSIAKKRGEKYLILAATSGDTGPAALNTFKNKENIQVACLCIQVVEHQMFNDFKWYVKMERT